jgi:hypothetical protein
MTGLIDPNKLFVPTIILSVSMPDLAENEIKNVCKLPVEIVENAIIWYNTPHEAKHHGS